MGDDDTTIIVPPQETGPPPVSATELWHIEHEARHQEHMAHLESIREEHRAEIMRVEERVNVLEGAVSALASTPAPESPDAAALDQALDTVSQVGEVIADISESVNQPDVIETPSSTSSHSPIDSAPAGEVEPDVDTNEPANSGGRRGSRFW